MTFSASSGQILIKDSAGHTVFDSNEKLFNGTDFITGSITLPQHQATSLNSSFTNIDITTDHVLASVNTNADTVVGSFSASTSGSAQGVVGLGWFCANGTYVHYVDSGGSSNLAPFNQDQIFSFAGYTFFASFGTLYLRERVYLTTIGPFPTGGVTETTTLFSVTLNFKLYCGTFT